MKKEPTNSYRTSHYFIHEPLPFRFHDSARRILDRNNLNPDQEEIIFKKGTVLENRIRPQQRFFFELLRSSLSTLLVDDRISYFCVDIPLEYEQRRYLLARYYQFTTTGDFQLLLLEKENFYSGEPFFPRIGMVSPDDTEEDIPHEWRYTILENYSAAKGLKKAPFGRQQALLLKAYHENPEKTKKEIANLLFKALETINNRQKKIGEMVKTSFGVTLPDYGRSAARYWHEMGLTFPKVL